MITDDESIEPPLNTRETRLRTGRGDDRGDDGAASAERSLDRDGTTVPGARDDDEPGAEDPARMGHIGRFIVLRRIGAGGMGVVYLAYDNALDRRVAIKLLRGVAAPDPERTARMRREAQAMAKLSHPNVLQIYEAGESEGALFLAMEYIHGGSLRAWLARPVPEDTPGPAPARDWRDIVAVFVQAGRGLAAAHQAGLVHRDFKPETSRLPSEAPLSAKRRGSPTIGAFEGEAVCPGVVRSGQDGPKLAQN